MLIRVWENKKIRRGKYKKRIRGVYETELSTNGWSIARELSWPAKSK